MGFSSKNTGVGCHALLQGVFPCGSILMPILTVTLWACIQIVADLKTNVNSLTRLGNLKLYLFFSCIFPLFKLSTFYFLLLSHAIQYIHTSVYVCVYICNIIYVHIYMCVCICNFFSTLYIVHLVSFFFSKQSSLRLTRDEVILCTLKIIKSFSF